MEVADTSFAIKGIEEKNNGQDTQFETTHSNGKYICSGKSVEPISERMAKLLLLLYQKRSERRVALCEPTTWEMVQMEQADELVQEPQMAQYIV